jgi:uncharacterized RDD family membrane protein YckC
MAKLILNPTSSTRREIALNRNLVSIGRDPSNDLVLPDAMVSRRHAVIEYRGSQYYVRDCNSSNGSVVNGDRVSERNLRDGDLVAIGTARLLFRDDVPDAGAKVVPHPSSPRLECSSCQSEYRKGDLFCRECGAAIAPSGPPRIVCASCGSAVLLPARFCNACGTPLSPDGQRVDGAKPPGEPVPARSGAPASAPSLAPLESDEPPTRPGGTSRVADPPPSEEPPPESGFEARVGDMGQGSGASSPSAAVAPALALSTPALPSPRARLATAEWPFRQEGPRSLGPAREAGPGPKAPTPAPFGPRLGAGLVDALVVVAGQALLLGPLAYYWSLRELSEVSFVPVLASVTLSVLALLLGAAYFIGFWGLRGATPGKRLLGLRVTDEAGQGPIGLARAALRFLGYLLSAASLGIGFLMVAFVGDGLHDRIAGTHVVRGGARKA